MATARIGLRHDTAANWAAENPTLLTDETVLIDDETKIIRGDGNLFNTSYEEVGTYGATGMINGKYVGELFYRAGSVTATSASFPAICLDAIDDSDTYSETNYPDLIDWLRDQRTEYIVAGLSPVSSWTVTVSGSNITFPGNDSDTAVLTAIVEEAYYVDAQQSSPSGSPDYTNLAKTINVAGTDYVITGINLGTSVVTVTGSPSTGSQTAIFYPHRIAGSSTTARLFQATGMGLMSPGDPDGLFVTGVRRRGYMQQITGEYRDSGLARGEPEIASGAFSKTREDSSPGSANFSTPNTRIVFDSADSPGARTGPETHGPSLIAHLYMATGRYIA